MKKFALLMCVLLSVLLIIGAAVAATADGGEPDPAPPEVTVAPTPDAPEDTAPLWAGYGACRGYDYCLYPDDADHVPYCAPYENAWCGSNGNAYNGTYNDPAPNDTRNNAAGGRGYGCCR